MQRREHAAVQHFWKMRQFCDHLKPLVKHSWSNDIMRYNETPVLTCESIMSSLYALISNRVFKEISIKHSKQSVAFLYFLDCIQGLHLDLSRK